MSPPDATHRPELDGWRGLAILLVLVDHFGGFGSFGRLGVELFFALSGLLIGRILFIDRMPLRLFLRRRAARILPVLYLYLLAVLGVALIGAPDQDLAPLGWAAVFLGTYLPGPDIWSNWLPVGHLWSLNVEEHAYLLMAAVAACGSWATPRRARLALGAAAAGCVGFYLLYRLLPLVPPGASPPFLRSECAALTILASAALQLALHDAAPTVARRSLALGSALALVSAGLVLLATPVGGNVMQFVVLPIGLALVVNGLHVAPVRLTAALSAPGLRWFGRCSFSLYVWHYPFWLFANRETFGLGHAAWGAVAMAVALASYYLWEEPMRRRLRGRSPD